MEWEEWPDDDGSYPGVPLPSPDDRLWRHPSELAATVPLGPTAAPARAGRGLVGITVVASVAASALFVTGLLAVTVGLGSSVRDRSPGVTLASSASTLLAAGRGTDEGESDSGVASVAVVAGGQRRTGTAVVLDRRGTLATTATLVTGAQSVDVTHADGSHATATLAGVDPESGLAVLTVDARTVPAVWRSALHVRAGDAVQLRDRWTATPPVPATVAALGQEVTTALGTTYRHAIRLDASVWSVAEGASVRDSEGRVVGLATLAADGSVYALPIDIARGVAASVHADGAVRPALLGVEGNSLDTTQAEALGVDGGAVVSEIDTDGPAAQAGIRAGDVIVEVGGQAVPSVAGLVILIRAHQPGDTVSIAFLRNGERLRTTVTLGERAVQTG